DRDCAESGEQTPEFADAELQQHRRIVVLEADLHQLRERVEPRHPVVDLKDGLAAWLQDAAALLDQFFRVGSVLDNPVGVDEVKAVGSERELLAVGDLEGAVEPLLGEVGAGQLDRRGGKIDTGDAGAAAGEPRQVDAGAAADFENQSTAIAVKSDESEQVVQLLEVVLVEVVEKTARADRMAGDVEIVDVMVPVVAYRVGRGHGTEL